MGNLLKLSSNGQFLKLESKKCLLCEGRNRGDDKRALSIVLCVFWENRRMCSCCGMGEGLCFAGIRFKIRNGFTLIPFSVHLMIAQDTWTQFFASDRKF